LRRSRDICSTIRRRAAGDGKKYGKPLYVFVIVTGILTAVLAMWPGFVFLAFVIARPIGAIFVAVPMAFLIGVAFLIGNVALHKHGAMISLTTPALLLVIPRSCWS
jgi:hypothetical protein